MFSMREFGSTLASRHLGAKVRRRLVEALRESGAVTVDFSGVEVASPSFLDECFGKLVMEGVKGTISFQNTPDEFLVMIRTFVRKRKLEQAQHEQAATVQPAMV